LRVANVSLFGLLQRVYGPTKDNPTGIRDDQFLGLPAWARSERFDVEARMDASTMDALNKLGPDERKAARRQMLLALLADRFKLAVHIEVRELPIYLLVVAKDGLKLKEAIPDPKEVDRAAEFNKSHPGAHLMNSSGNIAVGGGGVEGCMQVRSFTAPFAVFANELPWILGRNVVDKTGLIGKYDFTILFQWPLIGASASTAGGGDGAQPVSGAPSAPTPPPCPSVFTALQRQFGLKLESSKGQVQLLQFDHAERPTGN
jgi:uncharacterized protein (TIGR03435 family)